MQVEITVTYADNPQDNYTVQCTSAEAAAREPWAALPLSDPRFIGAAYDTGGVNVVIRAI